MIILLCFQTPEYVADFVIGLKLYKDTTSHRWTDGRPLSYTDWLAPNRYVFLWNIKVKFQH